MNDAAASSNGALPEPNLGHLTHTTAMCWAAAEGNVALMQRLRDHGVDVNTADYDRRTPMHVAVSDNQVASVEYLLQCGARIDVLDRWGRSPLDCALETKNARILELLERAQYSISSRKLALFDPNGQEGRHKSWTATKNSFFLAIARGDTESVKRAWLNGLDVDITDDMGRTALHVAVENAQLGVIELLLSADVNTTAIDAHGRSAMSIAVEKKLSNIAEMLRDHQKLKLVIQATDTVDQQHISQAFRAIRNGDLEQVRRLVPAQVNPDVQDYDMRTLLHIASAEGHLQIAKHLVECGANVNLLDRWGTSPLTEAIDFAHNHLARFLIANNATESGNRVAFAMSQIDSITLNTALEYALRVVTRNRWLMGQVYCPVKDDYGNCILVAHSVWHKNDAKVQRRLSNGDLSMPSSPSSGNNSHSNNNTGSTFSFSASLGSDPVQIFRKVGSLMLIEPGQGHTGSVYSTQHPEWLLLNNVQQSHFFLLPHARHAGFQTIVSVPMIYKMTTIAVLSWYSDEAAAEDIQELQRIQRLLRSVTILSALRQELLNMTPSPAGITPVLRFQYCQSLDSAVTANGELIDTTITPEDVRVGDVLPLALEWGLFDHVNTLASSMSSEDHAAVIALLRSLVSLLRRGIFNGVIPQGDPCQQDDQSQADVIVSCKGVIRTKWALLVHLRYYLLYLHCVSPTEGTVFTDVNELVPVVNKFVRNGENMFEPQKSPRKSTPEVVKAPEAKPPSPANDCVLCKFKVPGHMHPGKDGSPAKIIPATLSPVAPLSPQAGSVENYFGRPGSAPSPVLREIDALLPQLEREYDRFARKSSLSDRCWDGYKSTTFTSSELYDAIGAAHEAPRRKSSMSNPSEEPRKKLLETMNQIMQDSSCLISLDQLLAVHECLMMESKGQAGVIRTSAAVGFASPRIYRVFIPAGEIMQALRNLVETINDSKKWQQRQMMCAYYLFAVFVFYIHPFHDGNGRCGRLVANLISKKLGFPAVMRAADKTIQVAEFLQKAIVSMEIAQSNRRQTRQSRTLSTRKENTSMWF